MELLFADLALQQNEGIRGKSGTDGHIKTSQVLSIKHHMLLCVKYKEKLLKYCCPCCRKDQVKNESS